MTIETPLQWAHVHAQNPNEAPHLQVQGQALPLIAIYAEPYQKHLLYQHETLTGDGKPFHAEDATQPQDYYQYFYDVAGKGDIAIEITTPAQATHHARGERECWVSAWDAEKEQGVPLGHLTVKDPQQLHHELEAYIAQKQELATWFNQPSQEIQAPASWLGRMMQNVKQALGGSRQS